MAGTPFPIGRGPTLVLPQLIDSGRGTTTAGDAQGTPTQSHMLPSILVYEDKLGTPHSETSGGGVDHHFEITQHAG